MMDERFEMNGEQEVQKTTEVQPDTSTVTQERPQAESSHPTYSWQTSAQDRQNAQNLNYYQRQRQAQREQRAREMYSSAQRAPGDPAYSAAQNAQTTATYSPTQHAQAAAPYGTTQREHTASSYNSTAQRQHTASSYSSTAQGEHTASSYSSTAQREHTASAYRSAGREYNTPLYAPTPQRETKKKGRWPALVASALIFGLIAGSVMYGVNLVGNLIHPTRPQTEAAVPSQQQTTLSLATTGGSASGSAEEGATAGNSKPESAVATTGTKTVAQVAEDAMPALVTIATVSVQEMQSFFGVQQYEAEGAGTGVIVGENDTELLIATNEHVVSGANQVSIGFINEEVVSAQVKGEDAATDLAIVSVKKEDIPESTLSEIKIAVIGDSDALVLGEQVVAIGNALGVGQSVTSGYVSALGRELDLSDGYTNFTSSDLIQTDAAINSGNSGGALLNMRGELIGINEAKSAYTSSGVTVDNVGYAIPMSKAQPILEELMNQTTREKYDEEEQGYLGVSLANVSSDMAQMYSMPEGVCFTEVAPDSPAAKAGALKGDVLIEVEGRSILSADALMRELQYYRSGDTIEMKVLRADQGEYKEQTLTATLGTKDVLNALSQTLEDGQGDPEENGQSGPNWPGGQGGRP